jgi:simple sugar transport system permease protein
MQNLSNQQRRQVRGLTTMTVLLIGFLYLFYFNSDSQENITFGFILGEEWKLINEWTIASRSGAILFLSIATNTGNDNKKAKIASFAGISFNPIYIR